MRKVVGWAGGYQFQEPSVFCVAWRCFVLFISLRSLG